MKKLLAIVTACVSMSAHAQQIPDYDIVTGCGEPSGVSFFYHNPALPPNLLGWAQDKISGGRVLLARHRNGDYDLLIKDTRAQLYSVTADLEGTIHPLLDLPENIVLLVTYSGGTYELLHFALGVRPVLTLTILRADPTALVRSHKLLAAACVVLPNDS